MASLSHYLYERRRLREASAWLNANDETIVATAMYHLNRMASGMGYCTPRERIYELKNHLVRVFYERGYCERVIRQRQTFECWNCNGTGNDDWTERGTCRRCQGTGIYREHVLYCFVFDVNGKRFAWHQPDKLVTWQVIAEWDDTPYEQVRGRWEHLSSELTTAYEALVYVYLKRHGAKPDVSVSNLRSVLRYYTSQFKYTRIGRPIYNRYTAIKYRINPQLLDEIPF